MDDRDDSRAVTHLVTRLDPLYGERAEGGRESSIASPSRSARTAAPSDERILDDLLDDHYLVEQPGHGAWRYDVLRKIWVHRRRLG